MEHRKRTGNSRTKRVTYLQMHVPPFVSPSDFQAIFLIFFELSILRHHYRNRFYLMDERDFQDLKDSVNQAADFFEMLIGGDEFRTVFDRLCGNPNIIGRNRGPLLPQLRRDS